MDRKMMADHMKSKMNGMQGASILARQGAHFWTGMQGKESMMGHEVTETPEHEAGESKSEEAREHMTDNRDRILSAQGETAWMKAPGKFKPQNPMTRSGRKVMKKMVAEYGTTKARKVFYGSINKKKPGSSSWHK